MRLHSLVAGIAALGFLSAPVAAEEFVGGAIMSSETALGEILTDSEGMTLYIFDRDEPGVSNCYDQCAVNWPPLLAEEGATPEGDFTLVERTDGTTMWAHKGWPLYYWVKDQAPGDTTGDMVGEVWHTAVYAGM